MREKVDSAGKRSRDVRRAHRRAQWKRPDSNKRRPGVFEGTRAALVRALEKHEGVMWDTVCRTAIVAGYAVPKQIDRERRLRSDGAESLLAVLVTMLYMTDLRSGLVIRPPKGGGGRWQRHTLQDLAGLVFNQQDSARVRQVRRAINVMVGLRFAARPKYVRFPREDGAIRSEPMVRSLNLDRICHLAGTLQSLQRDRAYAIKKARERLAGSAIDGVPQETRENAAPAVRDTAVADALPGSTGPPQRKRVGPQHARQLLEDLEKIDRKR